MYNGTNNGQLFLSVRDATQRLGFSDPHVAVNAFVELQELGLIEKTVAGFFSIKAGIESRAAAWRLTWIGDDARAIKADRWPVLDIDRISTTARKRLARRQAVLKRYEKDRQRGKFAVKDSTTILARSVQESTNFVPMVDMESCTASDEHRAVSTVDLPKESTTHILYHGGQGESVEFLRNDLSNLWLAAAADRRLRFAASVPCQVSEVEDFVNGADLSIDKIEKIRELLSELWSDHQARAGVTEQ